MDNYRSMLVDSDGNEVFEDTNYEHLDILSDASVFLISEDFKYIADIIDTGYGDIQIRVIDKDNISSEELFKIISGRSYSLGSLKRASIFDVIKLEHLEDNEFKIEFDNKSVVFIATEIKGVNNE